MVDQLSPKQVKKYHTNERLLIQRLGKYEGEHLLFIENFEVPFTNNEAERSFRSLKAIMHISGTFRSEKHAHYVMSIQSLLGTGRKQKLNMFDIIKNTLAGDRISY
ncbi:MAG: IS66 family transposase [Culicoidibacterales bacterium]